MTGRVYGVDLGTCFLKIYKKGKGVILNQRNIIAIENKRNVLAVGDEAYEMYEKAPANVSITNPVRNGVIADIANMEKLFSAFMKECTKASKLQTADYLVAIPMDVTEVEKRAFVELIEGSAAKVRKVKIVAKPIAAALGAGLDVNNAYGVMMVDIGASTTEIAIISLGGIVISQLVPIGGDSFNEVIINDIKKRFNLLIGNKTAYKLKTKLGNINFNEDNLEDNSEVNEEKEMSDGYMENDNSSVEGSDLNLNEDETVTELEIYGRNVVTGLPQKVVVTSEMVIEAMQEPLEQIMEAIKRILERTPPEISADIIDSGVYIAGGSATIKGIDRLVHEHTGLEVNVCDEPEQVVIKGLGKIIENPKLKCLAYEFRK